VNGSWQHAISWLIACGVAFEPCNDRTNSIQIVFFTCYGTVCLFTVSTNSYLDTAVAQTVRLWVLTAEPWVESRMTSCKVRVFPASRYSTIVSYSSKCAVTLTSQNIVTSLVFNPLNAELNPICYLLALLGAHHFLHVSRIRVKSLTFRLLLSYIY